MSIEERPLKCGSSYLRLEMSLSDLASFTLSLQRYMSCYYTESEICETVFVLFTTPGRSGRVLYYVGTGLGMSLDSERVRMNSEERMLGVRGGVQV